MTDNTYFRSDLLMPQRRGILKQQLDQPEGSGPLRQQDTCTSATDSLHQDSMSSHYEYPRGGRSPFKGVPQSSEKVISALKDLQEKIKRMELERTAAEKRLNSLSRETSQYHDVLNHRRTQSMETSAELTRRTQELQGQLRQAEDRCHVVERQLSDMRQLVQRAERERDNAIRQRDVHSSYTVQSKESELRLQQERLEQLEREKQRLKATQSAAEGKIRDLEERVLEEQHQRKLIQDKAAQLQTAAETNRILLEAEKVSSPPASKLPRRKKRKKKPDTVHGRAAGSPGHLHVKVGKIPFVAGQSTTPSHSINHNMQNVLALMKTHNPAWCVNGVNSPHRVGPPPKRKSRARRVPPVNSSDGDLSDLLQCLQDEFGIMSCEHRELAKQIQDAEDSNLREDLERELDQLVTRMERKGQQIAKLKRHQEQISEKTVKKKSTSRPSSSSKTKRTLTKKGSEAEVQVITTVRTKSKGAGPIRVSSGTNRERGVKMLRDMQSLQTSLRKDDLSWD